MKDKTSTFKEKNTKSLKKFFEEVFGESIYLPNHKITCKGGEIILFNPLYSNHLTLDIFESHISKAAKSGCRNTVDPLIYEKELSDPFEEFEPYFFRCNIDHETEEFITNAGKFNVTAILKNLNESFDSTLSMREAIIFHLYKQWIGDWTGFPNCSVVTNTYYFDDHLNTFLPVVLNFDQQSLHTIVCRYSSNNFLETKLLYKKVTLRQAAY